MFKLKGYISRIFWLSFFVIFFFQSLVLFASSQNVIDEMGFLSEKEIVYLQSEIEEIQDNFLMDVVIVITDDTEGKTSMVFADDYFDYNGFGIGNDHDGILLLVNMDARELWISTTGSQTINQYESSIDVMIDQITPYLSNGQYYEAGLELIRNIESIEENGNMPVVQKTFLTKVGDMVKSPIPYIAGILLASIATGIITLSSKGKVTVTNRTYEAPGSFKLERQTDRFIRENIHRVKIETKSSSGGGSHTGSSGRSHGGGGGRF